MLAIKVDLCHISRWRTGRMNILITGSTGFIGSTLIHTLTGKGHKIIRLRRMQGPEPGWSYPDDLDVQRIDAVVHLAGEPVANDRWSDAIKSRIIDSRVLMTRLLSERLADLNPRPKVMISASAIGYYGSRVDEVLTEDSDPGDGFLSELAVKWEKACDPARDAGIRVVNTRIGVVLGKSGGMLKRLLPLFRFGLGGILGNGSQYMSWISIDDIKGSITFLLENDDITGPVNLVGPNPVTNREFTRTLANVLSRPAFFHVPSFFIRAVLGQMADEIILASARVVPDRLTVRGYMFLHPDLERCMRAVLNR